MTDYAALPRTDVVACASCASPTALVTTRAFQQGRNEHGELMYTLARASCVEREYVAPMREALRDLAPQLVPALEEDLTSATDPEQRARILESLTELAADTAGTIIVNPEASASLN